MSKVDDLISRLLAKPSGNRCSDIVHGLESLGYTVKSRKAPHHKVYGHKGTRHHSGGSFNCGHGKNPHVLSVYVKNIVSELERAKSDLEEFLGDKS
ncbi:hypothetical protein [Pusillimonas sp.]|uniref:hypothetical protein n=1 Tax=Pusillimonas sp. TaxID=3040095 RepID=UPI0029B5FFD8|nr:hypothetical protein [Pusillimonas sp.]MDX3895996.1 hypothetical protein [Pusillimonas sp.]